MIAVIMAGGQGTRLRGITGDAIPKPMATVVGTPVIERQIVQLVKSGFQEIVVVLGYLGNVIQEYFGDGSAWGVHVSYVRENEPLGTAGSFCYLTDIVKERFALVYGDVLFDVDWQRFEEFHTLTNADVTLFSHPNSHPFDSDLIEVEEEGLVIDVIGKKEERPEYFHNLVNAGLYIVEHEVLKLVPAPNKTDFEKEIIPKLIKKKKVFAYRSTEYVKDVGTPGRFRAAAEDIKHGIIQGRNLKNKQKCIFIDRDGTLNILKGFLNNPDDLELIPGVAKAIKAINESGWLCVVVTNQPVIARGECSCEKMQLINMRLEMLLGSCGAYLDNLYLCPHHPDKGFDGEIEELKVDCNCRKPKTGLLKLAAREMNIDLFSSWIVGDTTSDVLTGKNAGMNTVLVMTGEAGKDEKYVVTPTLEADNLKDAFLRIDEWR